MEFTLIHEGKRIKVKGRLYRFAGAGYGQPSTKVRYIREETDAGMHVDHVQYFNGQPKCYWLKSYGHTSWMVHIA